MGLDTFTMKDYYIKEVRVHLELAVPVWHSGLTKKLSADIERVQKIATNIILGTHTHSYEQACSKLGLKTLHSRRVDLCKRFATKTASESKHKDLFKLENSDTHGYNTRREKNKYREHMCKKLRFYNSPLPYLTRILNQ